MYPLIANLVRKISSLDQKTKDRLAVIGLLGLEAFFIFGAVSNFYGYIVLKVYLDIFLATVSTVLTAIITVYLIVILLTYINKQKVIKSFQK